MNFIHSWICSFILKSDKIPALDVLRKYGFLRVPFADPKGQSLWGVGERRKGRNTKKKSPCLKEGTTVVKAQGTEEDKLFLLSLSSGYYPPLIIV